MRFSNNERDRTGRRHIYERISFFFFAPSIKNGLSIQAIAAPSNISVSLQCTSENEIERFLWVLFIAVFEIAFC